MNDEMRELIRQLDLIEERARSLNSKCDTVLDRVGKLEVSLAMSLSGNKSTIDEKTP